MSNYKVPPQIPLEQRVVKREEDLLGIPGRYRDAETISVSGGGTVPGTSYASTVVNDSSVSGTTVKEALENIAATVSGQTGVISRTLWVDSDKLLSNPDGSMGAPYSTIQEALDHIGPPADNAETREHWTIFIAPGFYDEDITVPESRIISLIGLGFWSLGDASARYFDTSTTPRSITVNLNDNTEFGANPRPTFKIGTLSTPEGSSTHTLYSFGCIISGDLQWAVPSGGVGHTTHELQLEGTRVSGKINNPSGMGICNMYLEKSRIGDSSVAIQGVSINVVKAESVMFEGSLNLTSISRADRCEFKGDVTVSIANPGYLPPGGFITCEFDPITFAGPVNSFQVDPYSNYMAKNAPVTLSGSATKVILGDTTP